MGERLSSRTGVGTRAVAHGDFRKFIQQRHGHFDFWPRGVWVVAYGHAGHGPCQDRCAASSSTLLLRVAAPQGANQLDASDLAKGSHSSYMLLVNHPRSPDPIMTNTTKARAHRAVALLSTLRRNSESAGFQDSELHGAAG